MAVHRAGKEAPLGQPLLGKLYIGALGAVGARRGRGRGLDRQIRAVLQKFARLGVGHAGGFQAVHLLELPDGRLRGRAEHAVGHAGQIGQLDELGLHAENDVGGIGKQFARLGSATPVGSRPNICWKVEMASQSPRRARRRPRRCSRPRRSAIPARPARPPAPWRARKASPRRRSRSRSSPYICWKTSQLPRCRRQSGRRPRR